MPIYALGIEATYISNGIAVDEKIPSMTAQKEKFKIVTTGRIIAQKNPYLFNTIARYFEEFRQFEFIWAGDGEMKRSVNC